MLPVLRLRTDDQRSSFVNTWRWTNTLSNPNPVWSTTTSVPVLGTSRTSQDISTPQYRERVARGDVINNPFHTVHTTIATAHEGVLLAKAEPDGSTSYGDLRGPGWGGADPRQLYSHRDEVLRRMEYEALVARMKMRVATATLAKKGAPEYSAGTFAGEIRETLSYLRNPFAGGMRLAASIERKLSRAGRPPQHRAGLLTRRWDLPESGPVRKELSSIALEYMYGLRPLVREIEEILDRVQNGFRQRPPRERVGASETIVVPVAFMIPDGNQSGIRMNTHVSATVSVTVKAGSLYHMSHDLESSNRDWGIRLTDVPSTAWQLLPGSFVLDWFVGINSFIRALTPIAGLVTDAEWTVEHLTMALTAHSTDWTLWSDPAWASVSPGNGRSYLTYKEIRRSPAQLTPSIVRTRLSDGAKALSFGQAAGLLALFTQKLDPLMRDLGPLLPGGLGRRG